MGSNVQADVVFLRRVLFGMVMLTLATGTMAGVTAVHAMSKVPNSCIIFCE